MDRWPRRAGRAGEFRPAASPTQLHRPIAVPVRSELASFAPSIARATVSVRAHRPGLGPLLDALQHELDGVGQLVVRARAAARPGRHAGYHALDNAIQKLRASLG